MACDMSLRDVQTIHVSNMLERDSVTLLVSATKMVKTDLFTSSHVHFRRIEPNEFLSRIGMFLQEPYVLFRSVHLVWPTLLNGRLRR